MAFVSNKGYKTAIWAKQNTFPIDFEKKTVQLQKNVKPKGKQDSA